MTRLIAAAAGTVCAVGLLLPAGAGAAAINPNITTDEFDMAPDATCSLREAIQSANTNMPFGGCPTGDAGIDTITLTASAMGPTYGITVGSNENDTNSEGDFDVTAGGPLVIRGTDTQQIDTMAPDRIFDLKGAGATLTLENLIVHGGDVDVTSSIDEESHRGGNIRANISSGSLTLNDVIVRFGDAEDGGGIYAADGAQLSIIDSRIENNSATDAGAGVFTVGGPGALNLGITRSKVQDNFASSSTNGSGLVEGGGIAFEGQQMTIADSEIVDNHANHTGSMAGDGAAGGGIRTGSNVLIRRSLIAENGVTAAMGSEEKGGAILAEGGAAPALVTVVNSSFDANEAGDLGDGEGAAVYTKSDGDAGEDVGVSLAHVTFSTSNQTGGVTGGDLAHTEGGDAGPITLRASILPGFVGMVNNPCAGSEVVSAGFNVAQQADPQCTFVASDSTAATATGAAAAAADNGGFTDTFALAIAGRAVNFVPGAECAPAEGQDQRGYSRPLPVGGACDAGAYELHSCDGTTVLNGPFVACPVAPTTPAATPPKKKCKKKKKKRSAAAKKKKCKKKKRR